MVEIWIYPFKISWRSEVHPRINKGRTGDLRRNLREPFISRNLLVSSSIGVGLCFHSELGCMLLFGTMILSTKTSNLTQTSRYYY